MLYRAILKDILLPFYEKLGVSHDTCTGVMPTAHSSSPGIVSPSSRYLAPMLWRLTTRLSTGRMLSRWWSTFPCGSFRHGDPSCQSG